MLSFPYTEKCDKMNAEITGRTGAPPRPEYADAGEGAPAPGIYGAAGRTGRTPGAAAVMKGRLWI